MIDILVGSGWLPGMACGVVASSCVVASLLIALVAAHNPEK